MAAEIVFPEAIVFPEEAVTISDFFDRNIGLLTDFFGNHYFKVNNGENLKVVQKDGKAKVTDLLNGHDLTNSVLTVVVVKLELFNIFSNESVRTYIKPTVGGRKASVKKEICGKLRCIYKIPGSRKEHIKYKGRLIAVADYKKLMKKA